jgi:hypothetical protein
LVPDQTQSVTLRREGFHSEFTVIRYGGKDNFLQKESEKLPKDAFAKKEKNYTKMENTRICFFDVGMSWGQKITNKFKYIMLYAYCAI